VRQYLGGFHIILESLNKRSELFEEFLRTFVKFYSKSEGKQNWVLFPRDPRQAEEEAIPFHILPPSGSLQLMLLLR
jgi:hypothetical protein